MDEFDDDFRSTTYQTDCLETDALNLKNLRQLQLGKDLGIYIREKDGSVSGRIDAVSKGEPRTLAMYDTEFNVTAIPWARIEDRKHPKTGRMTKHLSVDASIRAADVMTSDDLTIDDKLSRMGSDINDVRTVLSSKIDTITADLQSLLSSVSSLTRELNEVKERLQSDNKKQSLAVESSDPNEANRWGFRVGQENDGRPSLQVVYDGETTSKFMGTPNNLRGRARVVPARRESATLDQDHTASSDSHPLTPTETATKPTKQRLSVNLKTPSEKAGNRSKGSASKDTRSVTQVETVSIGRFPRSAQE
jgi:hypothetical protein